jgi:hypothetical protein
MDHWLIAVESCPTAKGATADLGPNRRIADRPDFIFSSTGKLDLISYTLHRDHFCGCTSYLSSICLGEV